MTCKCCNSKEADKKNTHYLTDSIIRKCLNENGTNYREKGFMFGLSNKSPFVEFGFQRETNTTSIIDALGREPSEDEINEAKKNAFSVDNYFCSDCEKLFTVIENEFINEILPQLRGINFGELNQRTIEFENCILIRKFFLLQFWRTSVCDPSFDIANSFREKIQLGIFQNDPILKEVPLRVTFLNTIGDDFEYTKNLVGTLKDKSNFAIFFNDFIIQAFEKVDDINFIELYGLNQQNDFTQKFNTNENIFVIDILFNNERIDFASTLYQKDFVRNTIDFYQYIFVRQFYTTFGVSPHPRIISSFIQGILYGKDCSEEKRYSIDRFQNYANEYFRRLINYR
jgi:sulfur relay (sulfurtransferase) DsrC/TusE family protein